MLRILLALSRVRALPSLTHRILRRPSKGASMQDESQEIVIVSATRTPVGKFMGALSSLSAVELGAIAIREAVARAAIDPAQVDECLMGCVLASGLGQNPARHAGLRAGLADTVSATTINMVCGSGLK